jgi:nucleotide-binding universal stress UspA family protein
MKKLKLNNILVPYDFSKTAQIAVKQAAFIAAYSKSDLILVHVLKKADVLDIFLPILKMKSDKQFLEKIKANLDEYAQTVQSEFGVNVKCFASTGNITSEILVLAEQNDVGLIIMGTKGKDSNSDLFLGSNAYRLITKSEIPVMTVSIAPTVKGFSNILLPIDLSEHTRQKVNYTIELAMLFKSKITILGVYDDSEKDELFKIKTIVNQIEKICTKHKVLFESVVEKTNHRVSKTLSVAKRKKTDLIVTMTDQTIERKKGILSTYDHELINTSKIPVISISPEIGDLSTNTVGLPF